MKNVTLLSLLCTTLLTNGASAQDNEKMTYEKAMKSHREWSKKYQDQSITPEESQQAWDSYKQDPEKDPGSSSSGQLEEVWTGSVNAAAMPWGQGDYYIEISFGHKNQGGSAWLTVDNSNILKKVGIPSPFNYEGNYFIEYNNGLLRTFKSRTSGEPKITRISKFPTPQLDECTKGKRESKTLYCTGSGQMTCETGSSHRTCANNGGWMPWQTIGNPVCVTQRQSCP